MGTFSAAREIANYNVAFWHIATADFDTDGDLDLVASSRDAGRGTGETHLIWYENTDGRGNYQDHEIAGGFREQFGWLTVSDFDQDGDVDLLVAASGLDQVLWFENGGGPSKFSSSSVVVDIRQAWNIRRGL